jgi:hypothetical protein
MILIFDGSLLLKQPSSYQCDHTFRLTDAQIDLGPCRSWRCRANAITAPGCPLLPPVPLPSFVLGSRLESRDPELRPTAYALSVSKHKHSASASGRTQKCRFACPNSYVGQIREFALYIAPLKFPYIQKILLCPYVPHVVQKTKTATPQKDAAVCCRIYRVRINPPQSSVS